MYYMTSNLYIYIYSTTLNPNPCLHKSVCSCRVNKTGQLAFSISPQPLGQPDLRRRESYYVVHIIRKHAAYIVHNTL